MTGADRWFDSFQLIVGQTGSAALVNTCWELDGQRRGLLDLCFVMSVLHTLRGSSVLDDGRSLARPSDPDQEVADEC